MPIDTVQEALHIRRKKNAQVFRNIARLWEIGQKSHNDQELLDALHPWREDHGLRFFNVLPYLLAITSISTLIFGYFLHPHIQFIWSFLGAFLTGFLAYLLYEPKEPLTQVINYLEQRMTVLRYGLLFQQLPAYLPIQAQPLLVMSRLKQYFPLFNRGTESNEITQYASTTWHDGITEHQVLLFQYHYISEMPIFQENNKKKIVKEIHKDLWGAFIFQIPALGVAVSNQRSRFFAPYTNSWQSSDILINQKLKIFGLDQHQLAKEVGPSMRGHLRTMTMPQYQKFQQLMLNLIS